MTNPELDPGLKGKRIPHTSAEQHEEFDRLYRKLKREDSFGYRFVSDNLTPVLHEESGWYVVSPTAYPTAIAWMRERLNE